MIKFRSYLQEDMRPLTPAELKKPNGQTGEPRIEILRKAILAGTPVPTVDNKDVVFDNSNDNLESLAKFSDDGKAFELKTKDGKIVSSSKIGKSPIFGGGKGAGGGTENTAVVESAQCLWNAALLQYGANQPIEFFTPSILKTVMKSVDTGSTTFEQMVSIDPAWSISSYLSAQKLIKDRYINSRHTFHRDSSEMKFIYKAKKEAFKNSGQPALTDDKWNPGDIWAIEKGINLKNELDTSSIGALNNSLVRLFKERKVVGISLKLVRKDAKSKEYNVDAVQPQHKYVSGAVKSNRGNFFSNKGGLVTYDAGVMEIRPNNYLGANKIEIMGKTARGGGAGWGVIIDAAKRYMGATIPKHAEIKNMAQKLAKGDTRTLQDFYKMAKVADASLTYDYFLQEAPSKDAGWFSAKIAAVVIVYHLNNNKGSKADAFVNAIINYAASKSEDSSAFVKIYQ